MTRRTRLHLRLWVLTLGTAASVMVSVAAAQKTQRGPAFSPELIANLAKLRDGALLSDYAWRQVAHLTENIGPRLSGSSQADAAVAYVSGELGRLGLEVKLERVSVPHWVRGEERAELTSYPGQVGTITQKIVLTALGNSAATPADGLTAEVVVANDFEELARLGREKIEGKIVLFNEKFDTEAARAGQAGTASERAVAYRRSGAKAAAALGAVAALVRSVGNADYRLPHTGYSAPASVPTAAVTAEDADLLADLVGQGPVGMHLVLTPKTLPDRESANVIADLAGTEDPERVVIVSGHLDSWDLGTGAIDDAAGVAMAMETAALLKQLGLRPRRTIRVIAWMDEENRGSGSQAYLTTNKDRLSGHIAAIESDSGAGHPLGLAGNFDPSLIASLKPISEVLAPIGATLIEDTGSAEADVDPLGANGVPVFGLMEDMTTYFNYHHTAADTLDKISPKNLAENAAVMTVLAYAIADLPEAIPRKSPGK